MDSPAAAASGRSGPVANPEERAPREPETAGLNHFVALPRILSGDFEAASRPADQHSGRGVPRPEPARRDEEAGRSPRSRPLRRWPVPGLLLVSGESAP